DFDGMFEQEIEDAPRLLREVFTLRPSTGNVDKAVLDGYETVSKMFDLMVGGVRHCDGLVRGWTDVDADEREEIEKGPFPPAREPEAGDALVRVVVVA
ncbi:MAG: hypothetical protein KC731_43550, partial [Myxococcales bacterium]|nr:hypothetical protein [Myxococcales bacterium]